MGAMSTLQLIMGNLGCFSDLRYSIAPKCMASMPLDWPVCFDQNSKCPLPPDHEPVAPRSQNSAKNFRWLFWIPWLGDVRLWHTIEIWLSRRRCYASQQRVDLMFLNMNMFSCRNNNEIEHRCELRRDGLRFALMRNSLHKMHTYVTCYDFRNCSNDCSFVNESLSANLSTVEWSMWLADTCWPIYYFIFALAPRNMIRFGCRMLWRTGRDALNNAHILSILAYLCDFWYSCMFTGGRI